MTTETTQRDKLEISAQDAKKLLYDGENDEYEIINITILYNSRWTIYKKIVIKRKSDGKFFADQYGEGATETQDEEAWDYAEPNFTEVFPVEKTVIVYE